MRKLLTKKLGRDIPEGLVMAKKDTQKQKQQKKTHQKQPIAFQWKQNNKEWVKKNMEKDESEMKNISSNGIKSALCMTLKQFLSVHRFIKFV